MKLQHLAIIFVIIIFPIALVVGEYIQMQIDTITLQTSYSSKLQTATYDSIKAFRLNTVNNKYSSVSDSKVRDIEASISAYFSSLGNEIKLQGYAREELEEYTPAILYTLYDGYYIYSKYYNDADKEYQYGLKPYIYYTCRYKKGNIDVIINYTLDNYITVYGYVDNNYITKSGSILNPNEITNITFSNEGDISSLKYGGAKIEKEILEEEIIYLDNNNAPIQKNFEYYVYNNNKVYYEGGENYFTINSNFKKQYVVDSDTKDVLKKLTINGHLYSDSAVKYYYEAYRFSLWAQEYLGEITQEHAVDENGNKITDFAVKTGNTPIFDYSGKLDITDSCFDLNRISVIRRSIQSNLLTAIANYNHLSANTYEYVLPVFSEDDWYKITNNISMISFLQGIPIGAKYFNDYCIITNNKNKEVVTLDTLYAVTQDGEVHLINCKDIIDNKKKVVKVYKNIDFERQTVVISEGNERYYYPQDNTKCYNCLVNAATTYNIDYLTGNVEEFDHKTNSYVQKVADNNTVTTLRTEVLKALAREAYDLYKINNYFKGYDETIGEDSITNDTTKNITHEKTAWNPNTHLATATFKKKTGVSDTLKIQYQVNPTNLTLSDNTKWITGQEYSGNRIDVSGLYHGDKVYLRLFDGTYDGDYFVITIIDDISPEEGSIQVVEGTQGNKVQGVSDDMSYYVSSSVKVKITAGQDYQTGTAALYYKLRNIDKNTETAEQMINSGSVIEITDEGRILITARTVDYAGNSSLKSLLIYKDSQAPSVPTLQVLDSPAANGYYSSNVRVKLIYGQEFGISGIEGLHYEIIGDINKTGVAYNGEIVTISGEGSIKMNAYMQDNAGNRSGTVGISISADNKAPEITTDLYASDITTNSFRLNVSFQDQISGIDKIIWYYKQSSESTYTSITKSYTGEKTLIEASQLVQNLKNGTLYNAYAEIYDKTGNKITTSTINITTVNIVQAGAASISPSYWTNGSVSVTLPTKTGYTTQYQIGSSINVNGNWSTYIPGSIWVSSNTTVFYRLTDGISAGTYNSISINNIDKVKPTLKVTSQSSGTGLYEDILKVEVADSASGIQYVKFHEGTKTQLPGGKSNGNNNSKSYSTNYTAKRNGFISFEVCDWAGNISYLDYTENKIVNFVTQWTVTRGTTIKLPILGNVDLQIDYGDGTSQHVTWETPQYTYMQAGTYTVKISGVCTTFGSRYEDDATADNNLMSSMRNYMTKIVSWGCLRNEQYCFNGCTKITGTIPSPHDRSFENIESFDWMFSECTGITGTVPGDLFKNCTKAKTFWCTFNNSGITGIKSTLFQDCVNATSFCGTFVNCKKLTTGVLSADLFANNKNATSFESTFLYCENLSDTIPAGMFKNNTKATRFDCVFANCNLTGTIPEDLFAGCTQVTTYSGAFQHNSRLTGSIPNKLFYDSRAKIESFRTVFFGCTGLNGTCPALWDSSVYTKVTSGYLCFGGCTSLSNYNSIASGWK